MDANTLGYAMILLSIGLTWIAFRTTFFGMKIMAGVWWFIMFIYLKTESPTAITEGSGLHTAMLVVCIGIGLMIVLSGLGRGIQRSQKWGEGFEQSEGFHWKLPSWLKFSEDSPEQRARNVDKELYDYRVRLREAYGRRKSK